MKKYTNGRRVFGQTVAIATTMFTCLAVQANEHEARSEKGQGQSEHHQNKQFTAEQFINKAATSGHLEVQVGQLAQQRAQNQQVKQLGQTLEQDHRQANQRLMQIAQQKNITVSNQLEGKAREKLEKLQKASGAEFDKEFIKHALQHHKKDIQNFEQASKQLQSEQELRSFVEQTLPVLKKHLMMAQTAAGAIGVDVASIEADTEIEGAGAPAAGVRGEAEIETQPKQNQDQEIRIEREQERPRSSIETGADLPDVDADADFDINERDNRVAAEADVDVDNDSEVFQKGDGKILGVKFQKGDNEVLGLPTSNNDGTILGLFPAPGSKVEAGSRETYKAEELTDGKIDRGVETVQGAESEIVAVGGPAGAESAQASNRSETVEFDDAPEEVQNALRARGWTQEEGQLQKVTLFRAMINGQPVVVSEKGQVVSQGQQPQPQR